MTERHDGKNSLLGRIVSQCSGPRLRTARGHQPFEEQRDRIHTAGASLVRYARPLHRGLLASWVRLNAIGLIPLTRWRPLFGFSGRDRGTLPQTHLPFRSSLVSCVLSALSSSPRDPSQGSSADLP